MLQTLEIPSACPTNIPTGLLSLKARTSQTFTMVSSLPERRILECYLLAKQTEFISSLCALSTRELTLFATRSKHAISPALLPPTNSLPLPENLHERIPEALL